MLELRLAGYFPKHVVTAPVGLACPMVDDICSVSGCISSRPEDWVGHWMHNELGFFNTVEQARRVVPEDGPPTTIFAYRMLLTRFRGGSWEPWALPADVAPEPLAPAFRSLGFDAVSRLMDDIISFECSPLSCNLLAQEWPVNRHCLLADLDTAVEAAERFSIDQPEPGVYYVAEVLAVPPIISSASDPATP
jgi:hypothetical protein